MSADPPGGTPEPSEGGATPPPAQPPEASGTAPTDGPAADTAALPAADDAAGGDRRKWLLWGGVGFAVAVLAGVGIFLAVRPGPEPPAVVQSEEPSEAPSEATGVTVAIADVAVESTDNAALTAEPAAEPNDGAVEEAVEGARATLETYLNEMFADEETRFSADALGGLLTEPAAAVLQQPDQEALGAINLTAEKVAAAQVEASASAVADSERVDLVTLTYDAVIEATVDGSPQQMTQSAQMVFVPDGGAWKVEAVDATFDVPEQTGGTGGNGGTGATEAGSEQ